MKRCRYELTAHRYVDERLSALEVKAFEKHLAECSLCGLLVADLKKLSAIFKNMERVQPEPGFRDRVLQVAMSRRSGEIVFQTNSTVIFMKRLVATAACLCLLMSCSIFFLLNSRAGRTTGVSESAHSDSAGIMETYLSTRLTSSELQFISSENPKSVDSYIKITMTF